MKTKTLSENPPIKVFVSRDAAQAHIAEIDRGTYYLAHGEYARPECTARKIRGENRYYIHVRFHYYPGTFYARQNGPFIDR